MKLKIIIIIGILGLLISFCFVKCTQTTFISHSENEVIVPMQSIREIKAYLLTYGGYIVYDVDIKDPAIFVDSLNSGIRKVDSAAKAGTPLAWAPSGYIKINGKRYNWWKDGNDEASALLKNRNDGIFEKTK